MAFLKKYLVLEMRITGFHPSAFDYYQNCCYYLYITISKTRYTGPKTNYIKLLYLTYCHTGFCTRLEFTFNSPKGIGNTSDLPGR